MFSTTGFLGINEGVTRRTRAALLEAKDLETPKLLESLSREGGSHVCQGAANVWIIGFREGKVG